MITKEGKVADNIPSGATCQGLGCPFNLCCKRVSATSSNKCLGARREDNMWECEFYRERVTVQISKTMARGE